MLHHDADFDGQLGEISPIHLHWAQLMRKLLTQDKNDGDNLDAVVQHLLKPRVKNDGAKMVRAGFGVALAAELTFLSTFILPPEKWVLLQQAPLHKFFVGIPSPTCAGVAKD
jgi:hypothetical protein